MSLYRQYLILLLLTASFTIDPFVNTVNGFVLTTTTPTIHHLPLVPPPKNRAQYRTTTNTHALHPPPLGRRYRRYAAVSAPAVEPMTPTEVGGIYRPFVEYAWSRLSSSGLLHPFDDDHHADGDVPPHLRSNSSPARGQVEGSVVSVRIESRRGATTSPLRQARFALLETLSSPTKGSTDGDGRPTACVPDAIHVLNLVLFPDPTVPLASNLPVLGIDLVTLPGGKHLVAIDFQPVLSLTEDDTIRLFREGANYAHYEDRLAAVHRKHVLDRPGVLPWGGDVPPNAQRFFSPYALWTRLRKDDEALEVVRKEVFEAFVDYFDLYLELLEEVQRDSLEVVAEMGIGMEEGCGDNSKGEEEGLQGQREYLAYRRENDPARPMLTRLYGKEWCEEAIAEVLFKMV